MPAEPNGHDLARLAAQVPDAAREDKQTARNLRRKWNLFLANNMGTIEAAFIDVIKHGGKEDGPRVSLLNKVLDKLTPDQKETLGGNGSGKAVQIQINNLQRGPKAAQIVEVESQDANTGLERPTDLGE